MKKNYAILIFFGLFSIALFSSQDLPSEEPQEEHLTLETLSAYFKTYIEPGNYLIYWRKDDHIKNIKKDFVKLNPRQIYFASAFITLVVAASKPHASKLKDFTLCFVNQIEFQNSTETVTEIDTNFQIEHLLPCYDEIFPTSINSANRNSSPALQE